MYSLSANRTEKGPEMKMALVQTLDELMEQDQDLMFFDADLAQASGSTLIAGNHPGQFVEAGIAEANMVGMACGMSSMGFKPFIHSFAPFASRRVFDQIFLSGAYAGSSLTILGSDPGFAAAANGGTHTSFEDMALMRTIPQAAVIEPCDAVQMEWVIRHLASREGIHYVRFPRRAVRCVYEPGSEFRFGRGNIVRPGKDVLIIACGHLVSDALDAAEKLALVGIDAEVIDMFCIKPLDSDLISAEAKGKKAVVTFENHNVIGGLGSAAAELLMERNISVPFKRVGIQEQFGQVGSVDYLQQAFGLSAADLMQAIVQLLKEQPEPADSHGAGDFFHQAASAFSDFLFSIAHLRLS